MINSLPPGDVPSHTGDCVKGLEIVKTNLATYRTQKVAEIIR